MKDTEFLAEIKARGELERMGYKRVKCKTCNGAGWFMQGSITRSCPDCNGQGHNWEAPITK